MDDLTFGFEDSLNVCRVEPVVTRTGGDHFLQRVSNPDILRISLAGPFRIRAGSGVELAISSTMSKKLIAILLRSGNMSRSRQVLQTMLWDDFTPDPGANLRQLIMQTRLRLGDYGTHLVASAGSVGLVECVDLTDRKSDPHSAFFEDAGFGSEDYEDWLRLERSRFDARPVVAPQTVAGQTRHPSVGLFNPNPVEAGSRVNVVTDWVSNLFRDVFSRSDFIDFFDLRNAGGSDCDVNVEVSVSKIGDSYELSVAAKVAGRCYWSQSQLVPSGKELQSHRKTILEFAQTSVCAIERCITRLIPSPEQLNGIVPLYNLVSQLFSMSPDDVQSSIVSLRNFESDGNLAGILAWRGFAKMLQNGERLVTHRGKIVTEAEEYIFKSLEIDPTHPTALTIAAHFFAYIIRDFGKARELIDDALRFAPSSPFAHDVRATLDLYTGDLDSAAYHAEIAGRLGCFGPMRHYLAGTGVMLKTLRQDHEGAVRDGGHLLRVRPRFLPVMRHMSASLAALGQVEQAHNLVGQVRELDPAFGTTSMKGPDYAIPSAHGRKLIYTTLHRKGLHA